MKSSQKASQDGATPTFRSTFLKKDGDLEKWKESILHGLCVIHPAAAIAVANSTALPQMAAQIPYTPPPLPDSFPDTPAGRSDHLKARTIIKEDNDYAKMQNHSYQRDSDERRAALLMIKGSVDTTLWTDISNKHPEIMTAMWACDPVALYNAIVLAMTKREFGDTEVMRFITAVVALGEVVRANDKTNSLTIDAEIKRQFIALSTSFTHLITIDQSTNSNHAELVMAAFKMCSLSTTHFSEVVELEKPKLNSKIGIRSFPPSIAAIRRAIESSNYIKKFEGNGTVVNRDKPKPKAQVEDSITLGQQVNNASKKKNGNAKTGNKNRANPDDAESGVKCTHHPMANHSDDKCNRHKKRNTDTKSAAAATHLSSGSGSEGEDFSESEDDNSPIRKSSFFHLQVNRAGRKSATAIDEPNCILDTGTNVSGIFPSGHPCKLVHGRSTEVTGIGGEVTLDQSARCLLTGILGYSTRPGHNLKTSLYGLPGLEEHYDFLSAKTRTITNKRGDQVIALHALIFKDRRGQYPDYPNAVFKKCYEGVNKGLLILQKK